MAVFKSSATVHDCHDRAIGMGMAYVHLRLSPERTQQATGTLSLRHWEPGEAPPSHLRLADGRWLAITVGRDVLSDCSRNHILRYQAAWPPSDPTAHTPGDAPADTAAET